MSLKLPAPPVFPFWIRVNFSRHEALFQSTGAYLKDQAHCETSLVQGPVPMFQKFTGSVWGDRSRMALEGHDTGPLALHLVIGPPDNGLLPMTILSSSCRWPVTAQRRLHKNRSLCAYFPGFAPYLYCTAEKETDPEPDPLYEKSKAQKVADKGIKKLQGAGLGHVMIPTGSFTVSLVLGWADLVLGAFYVLKSKALGMLYEKTWGQLFRKIDGGSYFGRFTKEAAWRYTRDKMLHDWGKDLATGFVPSWEFGLPFKLASLNMDTGRWTAWTYEGGGWKVDPTVPTRSLELGPEPSETAASDDPKPDSSDSLRYWAEPAEEPDPNAEPADYWQEPFQPQAPGPYDPQRSLLDELLEGAPHAF